MHKKYRITDLNVSKRTYGLKWKKHLAEVATAVLLGVFAVWGLQEYRQLTALSSEMESYVDLYENAELRLIKLIDNQSNIHQTDISKDLKDIEQTQEFLKHILLYAPENEKEWIYISLIKTYELKFQLLERIIDYDNPEHGKTRKSGTSL